MKNGNEINDLKFIIRLDYETKNKEENWYMKKIVTIKIHYAQI